MDSSLHPYHHHPSTSTSVPRNKTGDVLLPANFIPCPDTVVCGRGKAVSTAEGNRRLKMIVTQYRKPYSEARNKLEKSAIVSRIVNMVKQAAEEGAFVKFEKGRWWQVQDGVAREKVGGIFRDCLHSLYRSSTKSKLEIRRARRKQQTMMGGCGGESSNHHQQQCRHIVLPNNNFSLEPIKNNVNFLPKKLLEDYWQLQEHYMQGRVRASTPRSTIYSSTTATPTMMSCSHFDIIGGGSSNNNPNINWMEGCGVGTLEASTVISSSSSSSSSMYEEQEELAMTAEQAATTNNIVFDALDEACDILGIDDFGEDLSSVFDGCNDFSEFFDE
jgi:hypothetical protein